MASFAIRLEDEFDMEADHSSLFSDYAAAEDSVRRRLEIQFDQAAQEEGEIVEEEEDVRLDVIIVSHLHSKDEYGVFECPICYEDTVPLGNRVTISCGHHFCMTCTVDLLKMSQQVRKNTTCPMCRYPCFLLETPDEPQFEELGHLLAEFSELEDIREQDYEAFRLSHFA